MECSPSFDKLKTVSKVEPLVELSKSSLFFPAKGVNRVVHTRGGVPGDKSFQVKLKGLLKNSLLECTSLLVRF